MISSGEICSVTFAVAAISSAAWCGGFNFMKRKASCFVRMGIVLSFLAVFLRTVLQWLR